MCLGKRNKERRGKEIKVCSGFDHLMMRYTVKLGVPCLDVACTVT